MSSCVCPWWAGYLLASPVRRLFQNPERLLAPYIQSGMTVLELGPGMGFFTLPMARIVGPKGRIICVDIQEKMLGSLMRRAQRKGLDKRLVPVTATPRHSGIDAFRGQVDCAFLFAVVHELTDPAIMFSELRQAMKTGGSVVIGEPSGHVTADAFAATLSLAARAGFEGAGRPVIRGCHAAVLKPGRD